MHGMPGPPLLSNASNWPDALTCLCPLPAPRQYEPHYKHLIPHEAKTSPKTSKPSSHISNF